MELTYMPISYIRGTLFLNTCNIGASILDKDKHEYFLP